MAKGFLLALSSVSWQLRPARLSLAQSRPGPEVVMMERFLALLRILGRKRRGRRYRADDDYQEGYEDVYYYTSKYNTHLLSE